MQSTPESWGTGSWKWRVLGIEGLFWVQETNEALTEEKDSSLEDITEYIEE